MSSVDYYHHSIDGLYINNYNEKVLRSGYMTDDQILQRFERLKERLPSVEEDSCGLFACVPIDCVMNADTDLIDIVVFYVVLYVVVASEVVDPGTTVVLLQLFTKQQIL